MNGKTVLKKISEISPDKIRQFISKKFKKRNMIESKLEEKSIEIDSVRKVFILENYDIGVFKDNSFEIYDKKNINKIKLKFQDNNITNWFYINHNIILTFSHFTGKSFLYKLCDNNTSCEIYEQFFRENNSIWNLFINYLPKSENCIIINENIIKIWQKIKGNVSFQLSLIIEKPNNSSFNFLEFDNDEKISSIHEYNIFNIIVSKPYSFAFFNLIDQKWSNKKNFSDYGRFDFFNISNKLLGIVRNTNIYILNMETQIFVKKCNFEQKILAITVFNNNQLLLSVLNSFNSSSNLIQYKFDEHSFIEISKKKFAHHDYIKQIIQYNYNYIITVGDIIKFWK